MRSLFASVALLAAVSSSAAAQITVTSSNGAPDPGPLAGQTNLLNFTGCTTPTGIVITGGACKTTSSSGNWAQPARSFSGGAFYTTTSPYPSSTIVIDFSTWLSTNAVSTVSSLSLYWGSIDSYQRLEVLDGSNNVLATIQGSSLPPANGNQSAAATNRRVNLAFGTSQAASFRKLRFVSNQAAFEFDDVALATSVVPEPATVSLLAGALGLLGVFAGRRKRNANRVA